MYLYIESTKWVDQVAVSAVLEGVLSLKGSFPKAENLKLHFRFIAFSGMITIYCYFITIILITMKSQHYILTNISTHISFLEFFKLPPLNPF